MSLVGHMEPRSLGLEFWIYLEKVHRTEWHEQHIHMVSVMWSKIASCVLLFKGMCKSGGMSQRPHVCIALESPFPIASW